MSLDRVKLTGFKSIRELDLELCSLNVLIGANGAGKSNFISLFELLNQVVEQRFQTFVLAHGGADAFLYFGQKVTDRITIDLSFGRNGYSCIWSPTVQDTLIFNEEYAYFYGDGYIFGHYDRPYGEALGKGHLESKLPQEAEERKVAKYVLEKLDQWRIYHFHDTSASAPVKKIGDINDNLYLRSNAGNLAAFLYRLQNANSGHYKAIRDTIRMVAPFFDDFVLRPMPENENLIRLEWRERGSDYPFLAHYLSDGTLRFMCLATLLLQPHQPSTILIDEPELGLHPYAISVLASLMRSAATSTQIIVSTQSVTLVNQFEPDDLLVVERRKRETTIERLESEHLSGWLEDYALGDLWEKNVLGGRPSR